MWTTKEYVDKAIEKARELNCSDTIWNGALLHLEYSARKKLHIDIRMPVGMTIEETQRAYCEALGVPYDESCITPERMLFITDKASEIYRSPHWYEVLPQEELKKRRQAYLTRGLTIDGRGVAVSAIQPAQPCDSNAAHAAHLSPAGAHQDAGAVAIKQEPRSLRPLPQCGRAEGRRYQHPRLSSLIAPGNHECRRIESDVRRGTEGGGGTEDACLLQERDCQQLIHDFYAKYGDSSKPMSQAVIRINAQAEKSSQKDAVALKTESSEGGTDINAEDDKLVPPPMPEHLPKLVELLLSKTPDVYKPAVAHAIFPPLATHLCKTTFKVYRQCGARGYPDVLSAGGYGRRQELCADAYQHDYGGHQTARP